MNYEAIGYYKNYHSLENDDQVLGGQVSDHIVLWAIFLSRNMQSLNKDGIRGIRKQGGCLPAEIKYCPMKDLNDKNFLNERSKLS